MKSSSQKTFVSPCLVSEPCVREKSEKEGRGKDGGKEEEREREREGGQFIKPYSAETAFQTMPLVSYLFAMVSLPDTFSVLKVDDNLFSTKRQVYR